MKFQNVAWQFYYNIDKTSQFEAIFYFFFLNDNFQVRSSHHIAHIGWDIANRNIGGVLFCYLGSDAKIIARKYIDKKKLSIITINIIVAGKQCILRYKTLKTTNVLYVFEVLLSYDHLRIISVKYDLQNIFIGFFQSFIRQTFRKTSV